MKAELKNLGTMQNFLQVLQDIDPEFPLHYALCLIEIARDEGLSLTDLASRTNLLLSTVSRIVGALSDHRQKGTPYRLIDVRQSKRERRRKEIYLNDKGRAVISALCDVLLSENYDHRKIA